MRSSRRRPPLVLSRAETVAGIAASCRAAVDLLSTLDDAGWGAQSRCAGWQVRDVAGHLAGLFADVAAGRMEGQGQPEVTARQAADRRHLPPSVVAAELAREGERCVTAFGHLTDDEWLAPAAGGFPGPVRRAALVLWYELYLHGDDVRHALGRESDTGEGLRASVVHVAETLGLWGWGPATLAFTGVEELRIRGGDGATVGGDPLEFLLAATGRASPLPLGLDEQVNIYRR